MEAIIAQLVDAVNMLGTPTVLDWAPIFLSVVAVFIAWYVPARIAKKQNQIAIFDKLFNSYSQLLLVRSFAKSVKDYDFTDIEQDSCALRDMFFVHFEIHFGYYPDISDAKKISKAISVLRKSEIQLYMLSMLISKDVKQKENCNNHISAICEPLFTLVTILIMHYPEKTDEADKCLKEFIQSTENFFSLYADKVEKSLINGGRV